MGISPLLARRWRSGPRADPGHSRGPVGHAPGAPRAFCGRKQLALVNAPAIALTGPLVTYWFAIRFHAGPQAIGPVLALTLILTGFASVLTGQSRQRGERPLRRAGAPRGGPAAAHARHAHLIPWRRWRMASGGSPSRVDRCAPGPERVVDPTGAVGLCLGRRRRLDAAARLDRAGGCRSRSLHSGRARPAALGGGDGRLRVRGGRGGAAIPGAAARRREASGRERGMLWTDWLETAGNGYRVEKTGRVAGRPG